MKMGHGKTTFHTHSSMSDHPAQRVVLKFKSPGVTVSARDDNVICAFHDPRETTYVGYSVAYVKCGSAAVLNGKVCSMYEVTELVILSRDSTGTAFVHTLPHPAERLVLHAGGIAYVESRNPIQVITD